MFRGRPIKKCAGVRAVGSLGSLDIIPIGREFNTDSISINRVFNSSKVNSFVQITRRKWCLNDLTAASHMPPKCGDRGGLKCHAIPRRSVNAVTEF